MSNSLIELPGWTEPDPREDEIAALVARLAQADGPADLSSAWPQALWSLVQGAGATRWTLPRELRREA